MIVKVPEAVSNADVPVVSDMTEIARDVTEPVGEFIQDVGETVGEVIDRWLLERWESVTEDELRATAATLLSLHMRLLAPLPLLQQPNASAEGARSEAAPSEVPKKESR